LRPRLSILLLVLAFLTSAPALPAPHTPPSDDVVVEVLRPPRDPVARELRELAAALRQDPGNLDLALRLARRHISVARSTGDPRHAGYAEVALAPWMVLAEPPAAVLVMQAIVLQNRHEFTASLDLLGRALVMAPGDPQALLTRSTIRAVTGDLAGGIEDCRGLDPRAYDLLATVCEETIAAMNGHAEAAYGRIAAAVAAAGPDLDPGLAAWAEASLGEIAARLGRGEEAEGHFRAGLAADAGDLYLRAALADLLLDLGRPAEARQVAGEDRRPDALLLRAALAATALADGEAERLAGMLADRFADAARRGDRRHLREEARFALAILGDGERALDLALAEWEIQKEPADARILLEAALAAGRLEATAPVVEWLAATGNEDVRLRRLAAEIEAAAR
jgi:hypothetical protein